MQDVVRALRIAGIVIGIGFAVTLLWVVLIGPLLLTSLHPR